MCKDHFAGYKGYGTTKSGAYMCEKDVGLVALAAFPPPLLAQLKTVKACQEEAAS
jgi:hypothetical protein